MGKLLVLSDSHGFERNMIRAINVNKDIDMVIHLGDFTRDAVQIKDLFPKLKVEIVRGNNDYSKMFPMEKLLNFGEKKIFITHGHLYNVKHDYKRLIAKAKMMNADVVIFGHTHATEELHSDGILILNPGSISLPLNSNTSTCCVLDIRENKLITKFIGFDYIYNN